MCTTWQIPHDLNGHGSARQTAFQFSYHATRNHLMVTFRPSLKTCTGRLMMTRALPACGLVASVLDRVKARPHGYNRWSRPEGSIWRLDMLSQAAAQAERQLPSDLKKRLTSSSSSWWPPSHHAPALGTCEVMALSASSKGCSIRPSLCPRALGCRSVCT